MVIIIDIHSISHEHKHKKFDLLLKNYSVFES